MDEYPQILNEIELRSQQGAAFHLKILQQVSPSAPAPDTVPTVCDMHP